MQYLPELLTVTVLNLLALMSPGPDFLMVTRSSLLYSRRTGIFVALGFAIGVLIHVSYSLVGIGIIISKSIVVYSMLKYLGAAYLIYIGYKSLWAQAPAEEQQEAVEEVRHLGDWKSFKMGFLTNILNPKASLFFLAVFSQIVNPATPLLVQTVYGLEFSLMTFAWFSIVATILSHGLIRKAFRKIQHSVERVFGVLLIALGVKVALTK